MLYKATNLSSDEVYEITFFDKKAYFKKTLDFKRKHSKVLCMF